MAYPEDLAYSREHEWVRMDGTRATIGITSYAADELGDIVFVELPPVGKDVAQGEQAAVVESVKAASEVYAPVSGEVVEGNTALEENPALVNQAAEGEGWFFRLRLRDPKEVEALMDQAAYDEHVAASS